MNIFTNISNLLNFLQTLLYKIHKICIFPNKYYGYIKKM